MEKTRVSVGRRVFHAAHGTGHVLAVCGKYAWFLNDGTLGVAPATVLLEYLEPLEERPWTVEEILAREG